MYAEQIQGEDVIGLPGQALTSLELAALVGLADGKAPSAVAAALGTDTRTFRHIEATIRAKLGARTNPHMISRGFILGVLASRALCLLLATGCAIGDGQDSLRARSGKRSRSATTAGLMVKPGTASAGGAGPGPCRFRLSSAPCRRSRNPTPPAIPLLAGHGYTYRIR